MREIKLENTKRPIFTLKRGAEGTVLRFQLLDGGKPVTLFNKRVRLVVVRRQGGGGGVPVIDAECEVPMPSAEGRARFAFRGDDAWLDAGAYDFEAHVERADGSGVEIFPTGSAAAQFGRLNVEGSLARRGD